MKRLSVRAILDTIQEAPPRAREPAASREVALNNDAIVVEEVQAPAPLTRIRTDLDELSEMKQFRSRALPDVMTYLGEYYFAARSTALWQSNHTVNLVDLQWLQCAQMLVARLKRLNAELPAPPKTPNLIAGVRLALSITHFGDVALRHLDLDGQMRAKICTFVRTIEAEQDPEQTTKLVRLCTRFVSSVAFVRTHIVGHRNVRRMTQPPQPHLMEQWHKTLDALLTSKAQSLPEQFHDDMQQELTLCMLPVDASNDYAIESRKLGIYAGSATDRDTVVAFCEEIDTDKCAEVCVFVPWDRPNKPSTKPKAADMWVWECWQLHVFAYMFHSFHCRESGAWGSTSASNNVLDSGLFSSRYVVTWWDLLQPHTLRKLQCRIRYHERALPLLLQAGNGAWWVRTNEELIVCPSLATALVSWLHEVETKHAGLMEDGIRLNVTCFASGLHWDESNGGLEPAGAEAEEDESSRSSSSRMMGIGHQHGPPSSSSSASSISSDLVSSGPPSPQSETMDISE
jgi:hypothetical protein